MKPKVGKYYVLEQSYYECVGTFKAKRSIKCWILRSPDITGACDKNWCRGKYKCDDDHNCVTHKGMQTFKRVPDLVGVLNT